ncbi:Pyruvate dehydrogenase complex repressor (plasmid) [Variovorax sp. PBL-E5]|nr:Pyruvate dehydrogenase complex repressor [Variovorax sp. PBL-E5]
MLEAEGEAAQAVRYNDGMPTSTARTSKKRDAPALSVEQVCDKIRTAILSGKLRPGDKLTEQDLAAEYRVSRTPIREAIRQLEVERLVSRTPFVGVTVTQLRPSEIIELLDIREVLEGLVARLAAKELQPEQRTRLRKTFDRMTASAKSGNVVQYLDEALAFRRILVECSRSETLTQYVMGIENRLRLVGNRTALIPGRMQAAISEHKKLLQAIEAGEAQAAEQLNRERIQHIRADVEKSFSFSVL